MHKSKLIKTLKKLSEEELYSFRAFVESPYFNTNKEITKLLDIIISEGLLHKSQIDNNKILAKIYPGKSYGLRRLTDLMYILTNLLEEYLSIESYRQNKFQQKLKLINLVYTKDLDALVNGVEKDLEQLHSQTLIRDSNYFYETFMIHSEKDYGFRIHGSITGNESLQIKLDQLDLFYLALKLKDACEMINRSRILSVDYDLKMLDIVVPYLQANPKIYSGYSAIQIYLNMYLMLTTEDHEPYFFELKKLAAENEFNFTVEELQSIYGYAQNYCIRRLNQGNTDYLYQLFEIYKHILNNGLVFADNKNIQWEFKNFVSIGLRLKEYDWTFNMINIFKDKLPGEVRQNAYTYNLANYYYETGDYKKATKLLNSVEFTDIYYNLDSKAMLLKIYYKLEEEDSFYALVSAFGIYLRRNKLISKDNVEVYNNLLRFSKKAFSLKIKLPYERDRNYERNMARLKQAMEKTKNIANINWLKDEIAALETRK